MKTFSRAALTAVAGLFTLVCAAQAQINLSALGTTYTENFDTLITNGSVTWIDNSTLPGWYGWGFSQPMSASTGSSATPDLSSFGVDNMSSDRALGSITGASGGSQTIIFGAQLRNNSGSMITGLTVAYDGEQWRNGGTENQDRLNFQYRIFAVGETASINAANGVSVWIDVNALDFASITYLGGPTGSYIGTTANISGSLTALSLPSGRDLWVRWVDADVHGNGNMDDALAVDNFRVTAIPEPSWYALLSGAVVSLVLLVRRQSKTTA